MSGYEETSADTGREDNFFEESTGSHQPPKANRNHNSTELRIRAGATLGDRRTQSEPGNEFRLSTRRLRRLCSIDHFGFTTTAELPYVKEIIGQPRGVRAIEFGISIDSPGYNIFMRGPSGTGRTTAIRRFLERRAKESMIPHDWVYVYNFKVPHQPRAIMLPPGKGERLRSAMQELVEDLRRQIPVVLDTKEFRQATEEIERGLGRRQETSLGEVITRAAEKQLAIVRKSTGLAVVPTSNGQPIDQEAFAQLPPEQRMALEEARLAIQHELEEAARAAHRAEKEARRAQRKLEADIVSVVLKLHLPKIRELCAGNQKALLWLDELCQDILDNLESFKAQPVDDKEAVRDPSAILARPRDIRATDHIFRRYQVNPIVNQGASEGAPVVLEDLLTHKNLIGYIEAEVHAGGAMAADFTMIKPGALHRANGGYLVVHAMDILNHPFAWETLKRALTSSLIRIEDPESRDGVGVLFPQMPAPEPIPLLVKVVMLGTPELYSALRSSDHEFRELFKVKADFASSMARNHEHEYQYALFIAARCHEAHLPHFERTGVGKIVEFGSWLAGDQERLSTHFGEITDLIVEAAHWAHTGGKNPVSAADVQRAIEERIYRANLVEETVRHRILEDTIFIDTDGEVVGQVNGLGVLSLDDFTFGEPSRVTARIYLGNEGVVNIEREVEMSGPIHNKGLLTLCGYLGGKYALDHPLSLTASLTFEQNYSGVEGDSASLTELCALLSALSGYPLRQDIAVTGSVNQLGEVQPVGGVNQKVEGFYELCKARHLTGSQGVIIPEGNVRNLMLKEEIVSAVEQGLFHIYAVNTGDQAIEILTGFSAGECDPEGGYPYGTVHQAVKTRLRELAESLQRYGDCRSGHRP